MIVGDRFVWVHIPKTAGTFTDEVFRQCCPYLIEAADSPKSNNKHHSLSTRQRKYSKNYSLKTSVINIRRLIPWMQSCVNHKIKWSGFKMTDEVVENFKQGKVLLNIQEGEIFNDYGLEGKYVSADFYLKFYLRDRSLDDWKFLRVENLAEDFIETFNQFGLREEDYDKIREMPLINNLDYEGIPLTLEEEAEIKRLNPYWTTLEESLYEKS